MCGICGVFSSLRTPGDMEASIRRMLVAMRHRGPDGAALFTDGPCALGHTRLAVIDTSEYASQPMTEAGVTLVYNGELYTFREERRKLEETGASFRSASDTEVLLKLYLREGRSCFSRLRGMYAFALWDSREKMLICARDPFGIKPFLFSLIPGGIAFASELKGLLASNLVSKEISYNALRCLLERGSISQPASILRDVRWLLPGQMMTVRAGEQAVFSRFFDFRPEPGDYSRMSWDELTEEGGRRITAALERQLAADVPLGAFLSGGVDSSLLVALMAERHGKIRTFSVGFESGLDTASEDETDDALEVARHLGVDYTHVLVRQSEVADSLKNIAAGLDHPSVDGVNTWFIAKAARRELTVAVSGTGGDELFAGYPWFGAMQAWENVPCWRKIRRKLRSDTFHSAFDAQYHIFSPADAEALCPGTAPPPPKPDPFADMETLNRVSGLVLQGYTRDQLLADIDAAAMWHSLEIRVPLLDEDLLGFALALPPEAKIGGQIPEAPTGSYAATGVKRLLLAVAEPLLPPNFVRRKKRGFTLPFDGWLRGVLTSEKNELLSDSTVAARGFFSPKTVRMSNLGFDERRIPWTQPWLLMMTELWAQEVLDG